MSFVEKYKLKGYAWRLADSWFEHINVFDYENRSINYLEIGTLCGTNLISVEKTYGSHKDSKLYCIDPWVDYDEYNEYKNEQPDIYKNFWIILKQLV